MLILIVAYFTPLRKQKLLQIYNKDTTLKLLIDGERKYEWENEEWVTVCIVKYDLKVEKVNK